MIRCLCVKIKSVVWLSLFRVCFTGTELKQFKFMPLGGSHAFHMSESVIIVLTLLTENSGELKQSSPATCHAGTWGERRYSSYSFLTSALDGGEWSASRSGRALSRGKDPWYPLYRRLSGPQGRSGHRG
jgi:hypothetical protein